MIANTQEAMNHFEEALVLYRDADDLHGQAYALHRLGETCIDFHGPAQAISFLEQSLAMYGLAQDSYGEGVVLHLLGLALTQAGRLEEAHAQWRRALTIFIDLGAPDARQVRARLERLLAPPSQYRYLRVFPRSKWRRRLPSSDDL